MATSQNGYQAFTNYGAAGITSNPTVPGTTCKLYGGIRSGPVLTVALYLSALWDQEIERLVQSLGLWGYGFRNIRGSETDLSNHASATAWDLMAVRHPLGARTLSAAQLATLRRHEDYVDGVVRFGAFYSGRLDEMHEEINRPEAAVSRVADLITSGQLPKVPRELLRVGAVGAPVGGVVTTPVVITAPPIPPAANTPAAVPPFPLPAGYWYGPKDGPAQSISGMAGERAEWRAGLVAAQNRLMAHLGRGVLPRYGADGQYGATASGETFNAVRLFQQVSGRGLGVDGLIGPATWRELYR